ncbi:cupin domain-containing protein [Streptomyces sp. NPDC013457]|uniref:cupin domain-containing protein n=1 Tax=Streptomyces sp. NPDC013457 TaxID=3364866 RepID=UPI0037025885
MIVSYPSDRYHGENGEVSASFRPVGTPADLTVANGTQTHYLATTASTGGEFGLYQVDMTPRAGGPATHFHRTISESFFVLDGTVRLFDGKQWVDAKKGDFLYVPTGGLHAFRNESDDPASFLILFAPGAPREEYFEKVGTVAGMTEEERTEFFLKHDTYWTD